MQEALRRYVGELVHQPTDEERRLLDEMLAEAEWQPDAGLPRSAARHGSLLG